MTSGTSTFDILEGAAEKTGYWERDDRKPALADLLEVALEAIDEAIERDQVLSDWLAQRNMTIGKIVDMRTELHLRGAHRWRANSGQNYVRHLFLIGLDPGAIADLLDLDAREIEAYVAGFSPNIQRVFDGHLRGRTPAEIANDTGLSRQRVYAILDDCGVTEVVSPRNAITDDVRAHVICMLQDGCSPADIRKATGLAKYQVDNIRRAAEKAGRL